ncbi:MAG: hypothetical protein IJW45_09025 [Oscillospiraceae bacterium]|nr:hypothetical protein [Oscillospiraceae bacterium]
MKSTNKRLVSILLCLAMVLAVLPMAVFAETATTIYVQPNDNWKTDGAWFAAYFYNDSGNTWVACTDEDGDEIYAVDVPAGYSKVIFCRMNPADTTTLDWSNKWNQTADLDVPTDNKVVYVVDGWDQGAGQWIEMGGEVEEVEVVYYLRGDMNGWDTSAPMTDNGDGTWSITMSLTAGTYEYKAADAGWGYAVPASGNASVTIDADCDVTFVLDTNAGTVTATAYSVVDPEQEHEPYPMVIEYISAVGAGSGNFLYGVEWDPASSLNVMDGVDNVYTITYMGVAAGTYQYKFAANGTWDISFGAGCETVSGEIYDAWLNGSDNTLNVAVDGSTVTLTLDLSGMDFVTGEGAVCSVEVIEPAVSSAPEAMVLGSNEFSIASGDTSAITSTYVVEEAGILAVNVSAMTTPDGEVPEAYIPMQFGRMYALLVNGEQVWLPCEIEVAVGDVVEIGVQSFMGSETSVTIDLSIREPGVNDVKWQLNADATADSETVDLRLISWVDSLDYQNVSFVVTINGQTAELECQTVYTGINVNGSVISDLTIFNDTAAYFVTYTIENLTAAYFDAEITVTMNWTDLEGNVTESETRTIVISDAL